MVLSGGLFYRSPVFMKKENDRKINLWYNNIDSFDESSSGNCKYEIVPKWYMEIEIVKKDG